MAKYWLTFRIHEDANYSKRYNGLIGTLNKYGTAFWDGPTSFVAMDSAYSIDAISSAVKLGLISKDLFVIREIGKDNTRYIGIPGTGFLHFFPKAKKV